MAILSNTFATINADAAAESMFRKAVSTLEGVKGGKPVEANNGSIKELTVACDRLGLQLSAPLQPCRSGLHVAAFLCPFASLVGSSCGTKTSYDLLREESPDRFHKVNGMSLHSSSVAFHRSKTFYLIPK